MRELNITTREEGQRLDKILSKYLNKAPKSFVYKMLRKKNIKLNGKKATGNEKLSQGDQVCIYLAEDTINKFREEVKAGKQKIKLDVLYEDENVIMVNKPWGILSQKSKLEDISILSLIHILDEINQKGMLNRGDKIVLSGFGGGLTWGSVYLTW